MVCVHVAYDLTQRAESALQLHHLGAQHRVLSFCCLVVLGGDVQCCHELLFRRPQLVHLFFDSQKTITFRYKRHRLAEQKNRGRKICIYTIGKLDGFVLDFEG